MARRALFILTSHGVLGGTGRPTGWFLEEAAVPHAILREAGWSVEFASIAGGEAPLDPSSLPGEDGGDATSAGFLADPALIGATRATRSVGELDPADYDLVFLPGGHGTMWDFPTSDALGRIVTAVHEAGGVVGAVCHGPAGLVGAVREDGRPFVEGRRVAGFSNEEEHAVGLAAEVPFLLEDKLKELGGAYQNGPAFKPFAVRDGRLVTGQNPMSSEAVARAMLEAAG